MNRVLRAFLVACVALLLILGIATAQSSRPNAAIASLRTITTTAQANPAQTDTQDQQAIRQRLQELRRLYSPGNRKFGFAGYDVYINTDELMAYDNLAPRDTQINGWNNYRSLWETVINQSISGQEITRFDIDRIQTSGDLGWSGSTIRFRAKNKGKDFYSSQHLTHIWHKVDGKWRIVHEHAFSPVKVNGKEVLP